MEALACDADGFEKRIHTTLSEGQNGDGFIGLRVYVSFDFVIRANVSLERARKVTQDENGSIQLEESSRGVSKLTQGVYYKCLICQLSLREVGRIKVKRSKIWRSSGHECLH